MPPAEVVVVGGGHNGLVCACYLARVGPEVVVLEAAATPGGCIHTVDLPGGRGRLEVGAYEHGGIRASGVAADLELETRFGLRLGAARGDRARRLRRRRLALVHDAARALRTLRTAGP